MPISIQRKSLRTERIGTFTPQVQAAFAMVCQYMNTVFAAPPVNASYHAFPGSASWLHPQQPHNVMAKVVPWDQRPNLRVLSELRPACTEGIAVMLRNDMLDAITMQTVWEELGGAYLPCPQHPELFGVRPASDKLFQVLIWCVGQGGCALQGLPGVDLSSIGGLLAAHDPEATGEACREVRAGLSADGIESPPNHDRLREAAERMRAMGERVKAADGEPF